MTPVVSIPIFRLFLFLSAAVAFVGLFVPLMDNDAAHHAVIALRMYVTGDYVNLIDQGRDYLDKPHLHFWLSALSYEIFGATSFAYKLPSFLFSVLGVLATYRLTEFLYSKDVARLSAIMISTCFGFLLSVSDVRMDAILVSCIAFSIWQLLLLTESFRWGPLFGAAAGLALGFSTKGHIAVFVPGLFILYHLLAKKDLHQMLSVKWLVLLLLFAVFISPVLYCYYLQFNLHPEKAVRGQTEINGVKFILWDQVIHRMAGKMEQQGIHDPFFFFHSFLGAFAPWSLLAYIAVGDSLKKMRSGDNRLAAALLFATVLVLVTISQYQLPHYLNILFPTTAALAAAFVLLHTPTGKWLQALTVMQVAISFLILVVAALLNAWAFPVVSGWIIGFTILLLAWVFYFIKSKRYGLVQKAIYIPAASMLFFFFLMNVNFYPQLLGYQGGRDIAESSALITDRENIYCWENTYSSSFHFHSQTFRKPFHDTLLNSADTVWVLFDEKEESRVLQKYNVGDPVFAATDFEITRLTFRFLDPAKRKEECSRLKLAPLSRKK